MGILSSVVIYQAGKRRARKKIKKEQKRAAARTEYQNWGSQSNDDSLYELFDGDEEAIEEAIEEYYENS